jgi:hypothetical protein
MSSWLLLSNWWKDLCEMKYCSSPVFHRNDSSLPNHQFWVVLRAKICMLSLCKYCSHNFSQQQVRLLLQRGSHRQNIWPKCHTLQVIVDWVIIRQWAKNDYLYKMGRWFHTNQDPSLFWLFSIYMIALLTYSFISLLRYFELKSPNNINACTTEDVHSTVLPI